MKKYEKAKKDDNKELMSEYKSQMERLEPNRELTVVEHIRAKRIQKEYRKKMNIYEFERMYASEESDRYVIPFDMKRLAKAHKDSDLPAMRLVSNTVELNRKEWNGRKLDREGNRWIPKTFEEICNEDK
jgi:hypothetical protein